jgi:hypothetical protein
MCEIKTIFSIYSESNIDFDEITQIACCSPTSFWKKGEPIRNGVVFRKEYAWIYETPYVTGYDINPLIFKIMTEIKNPEILSQYCKNNKLDVKIDVVIKSIHDTFPAIGLSKEFIKFCSILNSWIDIDVIT